MNIEFNKEQCKNADLLLKSLCESDAAFDREEADNIFGSESESNFVCLLLEKKGLINIIAQTEGDLLYRFTKTEITCGFLENGGLTKEYKKSKKLDWYKIIPICIAVIFGILNVYQKYDNKNLKEHNNSLIVGVDSLKTELNHLKYNPTLNKEKSLQDTLRTKKESY
jgi:hypothetical protein